MKGEIAPGDPRKLPLHLGRRSEEGGPWTNQDFEMCW